MEGFRYRFRRVGLFYGGRAHREPGEPMWVGVVWDWAGVVGVYRLLRSYGLPASTARFVVLNLLVRATSPVDS
jgi:hypothetical protein